jgi:hypothetical protein
VCAAVLIVGLLTLVPTAAPCGESDQIIRFYQARVATDPDDPAIYNRLGGAYVQKARESGDVAYYTLAETAFSSPQMALLYVLVFGVGSTGDGCAQWSPGTPGRRRGGSLPDGVAADSAPGRRRERRRRGTDGGRLGEPIARVEINRECALLPGAPPTSASTPGPSGRTSRRGWPPPWRTPGAPRRCREA